MFSPVNNYHPALTNAPLQRNNESAPSTTGSEANQKATTPPTGGSVSVRISYHSSESFTYSRSSPNQQSVSEAPASLPVAEVSDEVAGVRNQYASTILSAIESQLSRDHASGADSEALQSRLQAGLEGFLKGYGEAFEMLEGLAGFDDDIRAQVGETRTQVLQGLEEMAERFGLEFSSAELLDAPTPSSAAEAAPQVSSTTPLLQQNADAYKTPGQKILASLMRDVQTLTEYVEKSVKTTYENASKPSANTARTDSYAYQVKQHNGFAFNLKTQDGDVVTINIQAAKAGYAGVSADGSVATAGAQYQDLAFSVEGELDEQELEAINDLLGQVRGIAESFFSGDMDQAVSSALALKFDSEEINAFDVRLSRSVSETAYQAVERPNAVDLPEQFTDHLAAALDIVEKLEQSKSLVAELMDWLAPQMNPRHPWAHHAGDMIRTFIEK